MDMKTKDISTPAVDTSLVNAYEAPRVRVVEARVERGFAISGQGLDSDDSDFGD